MVNKKPTNTYYTKKLGKRLTEILEKRSDWPQVYYDHGDSFEKNVCEPTLYGEDLKLAIADIAIVDKKARNVKVLCEIEAGEKGKTNATKIGGHMVVFLLAEKIRIMNVDYNVDDETILLIGLKSAEKTEKLKELINNSVIPELRGKVEKIRIVSGIDSEKLINNLEKEIHSRIGIA